MTVERPLAGADLPGAERPGTELSGTEPRRVEMPGQEPPVEDQPVGPGLSSAELTAWRTFLRAHATVVRALEAELLAEHDLPLASYDVLVQLSEAPDRRLRMTELADRVLLSRSGLTRLADRLEREGLLSRQPCPDDARGTLAVLTEAGLERLRAAWPTHRRGVQQHVTSRLTREEIAQLGAVMSKLVDDQDAR